MLLYCSQNDAKCKTPVILHIDGLVQERRNPSALAMELHLSCTNPLIYNTLTTSLIWFLISSPFRWWMCIHVCWFQWRFISAPMCVFIETWCVFHTCMKLFLRSWAVISTIWHYMIICWPWSLHLMWWGLLSCTFSLTYTFRFHYIPHTLAGHNDADCLI